MVECDDITGSMRGDGENDPVSEFIGKVIKNFLYHYIVQVTILMTILFVTVHCKAKFMVV